MKDQRLERLDLLTKMVREENNRQLDKWDAQDRSPFEWLCYLGEEVGELNKAVAEHHYRAGFIMDVVDEAIQTATLSLKIAEMYLDLWDKEAQS